MLSNPVIGRVDGRESERREQEEENRVYTEIAQRGVTLFPRSLISKIRQRALGEDRLQPI